MDRGEREESSSSPSVNPRIRSIQERGTSGALLQLSLDQGSSFFVAPELCDSGDRWIEIGAEISEERFSRLEQLDRETRCRKKALDLLARRSHSKMELKRKLVQRGFSGELAERSCLWLMNKGFLDDRDFARNWVDRQTVKGGISRRQMERKLQEKGISREIISEMLSGHSEEMEWDALIKLLEKQLSRSGMTEKRAVQSLLRRGFSLTLIRRGLEKITGGEPC